MPQTRLANEEIDKRGHALYERLRDRVETATNRGRQIVIDVESGDYEVGDDGLTISRLLLARRPAAPLFGARIGYNAVYAIGGVLTPSDSPR